MLADLSAEGRVMMKQSDDQTAKMVGLIDSVLQLEKMRSGSIKLKFSKVNVAELLVDSMDSVKPLARERAVILKCEYAGLENETIEADASWMEQVLVNVLLNSIKLSPEHQSVLIVLQSRADEVSISISDKGVGIPRSEHKLVFEKFHQLSNESSIGAGSGLGLAISKQLVELHHGEIKLTEADGRGNKFVITLPKSQAVPSKSSSESVKD
jgi:signal transduction histidine kinase